MKKILSVILSIFVMFSIGTMVVSCKNSSENSTQEVSQKVTNEKKVRNAVSSYMFIKYRFSSISGNKIADTKYTITYLSFSGDETKCYVSGKVSCIDIYGTTYNNTFDCVVIPSNDGEKWQVSSYETKSNNWTKS